MDNPNPAHSGRERTRAGAHHTIRTLAPEQCTLEYQEALCYKLVQAAAAQSITVSTAESLTAGLCAATITNVPGASAVLRGGFIVYATDLKHTLADVPQDLLEQKGPVDPDVAYFLARGSAVKCGADIGIGLTGVAGPDAQNGIPVGTVFISVVRETSPRISSVVQWDFSYLSGREAIRHASVTAALTMLENML